MELEQKGRWVHMNPPPTPSLSNEIYNELSYERKGARYMPVREWGMVHLFQQGRNRFPIGLLQRVRAILDKNHVKYALSLRLRHLEHKETKNLRDYQVRAVRALERNSGGILHMPCGSGKTRTALEFLRLHSKNALVIIPTLELKEQWEKQTPDNVVVRTYQSLKSKSYLQQFDAVVFDECHITAAITLQRVGLNLSEETVVVGLSATPFMRDDDNLKVESVLGPIVFSITLKELVKKDFLCDAVVKYHDVPSSSGEALDYQLTYSEDIVNNVFRNDLIKNLVKKHSGEYVLVLVDRIEHGENLERRIKAVEPSVRFIHGKSKNREDNDYRVLIATSIYDVGIDIPRLQVLILAAGGKSAIKSTQRIGRVLRKHPGKDFAIIHDFSDRNRWLSDHVRERRKIFERDFKVVSSD